MSEGKRVRPGLTPIRAVLCQTSFYSTVPTNLHSSYSLRGVGIAQGMETQVAQAYIVFALGMMPTQFQADGLVTSTSSVA